MCLHGHCSIIQTHRHTHRHTHTHTHTSQTLPTIPYSPFKIQCVGWNTATYSDGGPIPSSTPPEDDGNSVPQLNYHLWDTNYYIYCDKLNPCTWNLIQRFMELLSGLKGNTKRWDRLRARLWEPWEAETVEPGSIEVTLVHWSMTAAVTEPPWWWGAFLDTQWSGKGHSCSPSVMQSPGNHVLEKSLWGECKGNINLWKEAN